ncbi:zinc finger matrin-type protein 1 isoform X2 [Vanacampus margaritifer]
MPTDKDRFCELCSMVFTSPVVAKSHYEGKVHMKNLRKQSLQKPADNTEVSTLPSPAVDHAIDDNISGSGDSTDPTPDANAASSDSSKYCVLCAASFNNAQMALQHYNGRKHQRKKARQEIMKELEDVQEENPLTCAICNLRLNSVEMYQAHMQGNKHSARERKVFKLYKSRQKSYNTFADELAHYVEVQKARGLAPKIGTILSKDEVQKEDDKVEAAADFKKGHMTLQNQTMVNFSPTYGPHPHHHGPNFSVEGFQPPYMGAPRPSRSWDCNGPPSFTRLRPSLESIARPLKRRRKCSSSSSYSTSSSSSSSYSSFTSSGASDSDEDERKQRERRRTKRSRRERGRRAKAACTDKARRMQQKRARDDYSEEKRRDDDDDDGESPEEKRKKRKYHSKQRRQVKNHVEEEDKVKDRIPSTDMMEIREETKANVQQSDRQEDHNMKSRKEKKRTKEMTDNRTEEEKLWDDSILGC